MEFGIVVLKNVVIDRHTDQCTILPIPLGMSRGIYRHTKAKDPLRRLWVIFYIWEVDEDSFQAELKSRELSPRFVRDLAAAQMELLRWDDSIYHKLKGSYRISDGTASPESAVVAPDSRERNTSTDATISRRKLVWKASWLKQREKSQSWKMRSWIFQSLQRRESQLTPCEAAKHRYDAMGKF